MTEASKTIERICRLPIDFKGGTKSALHLLRESGYLQLPLGLQRQDLKAFLQDKPDLQDAWLSWSEDKRVSSGWYFKATKTGYFVGFFPGGQGKDFASKL